MRNKIVFPLALAANVAPLCMCLLYRRGAMLLYPVFAVIHILLFLLNCRVAKTKFQVIVLGLIHIVVTICAHQQIGWLYLHNVVDDVEGRAILILGTWVGAIWTTVLLGVSALNFNRKQKQRNSAARRSRDCQAVLRGSKKS